MIPVLNKKKLKVFKKSKAIYNKRLQQFFALMAGLGKLTFFLMCYVAQIWHNNEYSRFIIKKLFKTSQTKATIFGLSLSVLIGLFYRPCTS